MKNIKQIIKEELNKDKFISLKTFRNLVCDKQKIEASYLYKNDAFYFCSLHNLF